MMKKSLAFLLTGLLLTPSLSLAKPEQIEIKSEEVKAKEARAEALLKGIKLSQIEDPETRLALQAIIGMLDLEQEEEPRVPDGGQARSTIQDPSQNEALSTPKAFPEGSPQEVSEVSS